MSSPNPTFVSVCARMFWMLAGPAVLVLIAFSIWENPQGWLSPKGIAYFAVLALMLLARWLDPQSSDEGPAMPGERRRFAMIAITVGLAVWLAANALGRGAIDA